MATTTRKRRQPAIPCLRKAAGLTALFEEVVDRCKPNSDAANALHDELHDRLDRTQYLRGMRDGMGEDATCLFLTGLRIGWEMARRHGEIQRLEELVGL